MESTVVDNRRSFSDVEDESKLFYIEAPTAEDIRGADWTYSKMFTKSLVEGITTSAEMMDILMRRGIIGPEFEQRAQELSRELSTKIYILDTDITMEEKRELSIEVATLREELFQWNQRLNGPMSNTCEQIADNARLEFLTSSIVKTKEGKRVWDSYETFLREKSQGLALKARFEVMLYLQGVAPDFLEQTPEAVAMREVQEDAIAKIKEMEAAVEAAEANVPDIKEESPKPSKKGAKKKSS